MNANWSKILLFSLLFGAIGFLLGRMCGHCGGEGHGCERGGAACHEKSMCDHGGSCCTEGGHCDKPGCDHKMGGSCCKMEGKCDKDIQGMVEGLRHSGYQGDTTVHMGCCTVKVGLHGDKTLVEVEKRDSVSVEEHHP